MSRTDLGLARPWFRRLAQITACCLLVAAVLGLAGPSVAPASAESNTSALTTADMENIFVLAVNWERGRSGLPPLAVSDGLRTQARGSSTMQAGNQLLTHDRLLLTGVNWAVPGAQAAGENVGTGWSMLQVHTAFMNSPAHRAIILGAYRYVGIGITMTPNGQLWVTERFA